MENRRVQRNRQRRSKRILIGFCVLTWCLIAMNLFLLTKVHAKTKELNELLEKAHISLVQEAVNSSDTLPEAGNSMDSGNVAENVGTITDDGLTMVSNQEESFAEKWGLDRVDAPQNRTQSEILQRLKTLGEESSVIQNIYKNSAMYPDKMLEALANNPEMAGFVSGYKGNTVKAEGGLTEKEMNQSFPLFLQWDPRWGYVEYGDSSCIGLAGCGPTCLSMVLYYLTENEKMTPDRVAAYSMENGYYMAGTGTMWALLTEMPAAYGIEVWEPTTSEWELKYALDEGNLIICSMGEGDFTAAGHFIVIYGYDEEGFLVNDPNSVARSGHWAWKQIENQIKHTWVFSEYNSIRQ